MRNEHERGGLAQPDFSPLRHTLRERYGGKGWVSVADVLDFVSSDETLYHNGQVKRPVLN